MEKWDYKTLRDHHTRHNKNKNDNHHHRGNPSFSSTLLDAIYRSIDEGKTEQNDDKKQQHQQPHERQRQDHHLAFYRETMKQKQSSSSHNHSFRQQQQQYDDVVHHHVVGSRRRTQSDSNSLSFFSSSSSSDSSSSAYGGGFSSFSSSSESDSYLRMQKPKPKPKPIRTSSSFSSSILRHQHHQDSNFELPSNLRHDSSQTQKPNHEKINGKTTKSKSALKILYGEPNSPGARLASFLNSLFNSSANNNAKNKKKNAKVLNSNSESKPPSNNYCFSSSSTSRSCLSKTASSNGAKRSVRWAEDYRPCVQQKKVLEEEEHRLHVMKKMMMMRNMKRREDIDDDDDDGVSCASSDLFELENLSGIGIHERYREELPVYETTHFHTNRAIANGFLL